MNTTLKPLHALAAAMIIVACGTAVSRAQETNGPSAFDYDYYRIVGDRNIFNQNRSPARQRGDSGPRTVSNERSDSFSYVGFMHYEKGLFAFFDGTSQDYRRDLTLGGTIAGFRVVDINAHSVTLERDGNRTELGIGTQMRRRSQGEWQPAEPIAGSGAGPGGNDAQPAAQPLEVGSGPGADVLRNLMQRRAQEGQ